MYGFTTRQTQVLGNYVMEEKKVEEEDDDESDEEEHGACQHWRTLHDFEAEQEGDLAFSEGETLLVTGERYGCMPEFV